MKIAQRQVVAQVKAAAGSNGGSWDTNSRPYFAQVSGGEVQASVEKVYDGGAVFPDVLPAPIEVGDITVTRHYDPDIDGPLLQEYRPKVGKARFDVTVFTLDADLVVTGTMRVYRDVLLTSIAEPEGDASAGSAATFSLTFAVGKVDTATGAR